MRGALKHVAAATGAVCALLGSVVSPVSAATAPHSAPVAAPSRHKHGLHVKFRMSGTVQGEREPIAIRGTLWVKVVTIVRGGELIVRVFPRLNATGFGETTGHAYRFDNVQALPPPSIHPIPRYPIRPPLVPLTIPGTIGDLQLLGMTVAPDGTIGPVVGLAGGSQGVVDLDVAR